MVDNVGKIGQILEDYSPIQIGTTGIYQKEHFTVIGRLQLSYEAGLWNEWYILFDNHQSAWLGEASGQYAITYEVNPDNPPPELPAIKPGSVYQHQGLSYTATDVRKAQCVGGEGELPFMVGSGYQAQVADYRSGEYFLTIDYSHGKTATLYAGRAVDLSTLKCQLLLSDNDISTRAGRIKGSVHTLHCPNCGFALPYNVGVATQLSCPSCASSVDCSGDRAVLLSKMQAQLKARFARLELGAKGRIHGNTWTIIGLIECKDPQYDGEIWVEYLLFNSKKGFLWLVQTESSWYETEVLNQHPNTQSEEIVKFKSVNYRLNERYASDVIYAAGAFNWRVAVNDRTWIEEYTNNNTALIKEQTAHEITWSKARLRNENEIKVWFPSLRADKTKNRGEISLDTQSFFESCLAILWIVNLIMGLVGGHLAIPALLSALGTLLLWLPLFFIKLFGK